MWEVEGGTQQHDPTLFKGQRHPCPTARVSKGPRLTLVAVAVPAAGNDDRIGHDVFADET